MFPYDYGSEAPETLGTVYVVRDSLKWLLEASDYRVELYDSGESFIAKYDPKAIAVLVLDVRMPGMDGLELVRRAKAMHPRLRAVILSGYDTFAYAQQAIRCGAVDYLLKPIIEEDLNQAILHAMQSIDPSFAPLPQDRCSAPPDSDAVIDIIHDYIDKNYTENIKISMFADRYFFSREYLSKQFKSRYGCGIYEYVLQVRMERAKELLLDPDIKIQDIAQRIGYTDNNYFSKAFRNYYGISPSVFRQRT